LLVEAAALEIQLDPSKLAGTDAKILSASPEAFRRGV